MHFLLVIIRNQNSSGQQKTQLLKETSPAGLFFNTSLFSVMRHQNIYNTVHKSSIYLQQYVQMIGW